MEEKNGLSPVVKALLAGVGMFAISLLADFIRDTVVYGQAVNLHWLGAVILGVIMATVTYYGAAKKSRQGK